MDGIRKLTRVAGKVDADAYGVVERSPIADPVAMEVDDINPTVSRADPEPGPVPRKAVLLHLLGEVSTNAVEAMPHYLCRRPRCVHTGLTPELSRATARPQTRTNIPKKIAAVKWHRLERIVRRQLSHLVYGKKMR